MYNILKIIACDCVACPDLCDGTYTRDQGELEMAHMEHQEIIGNILLLLIAIELVILVILVLRLVISKRNKS